MSSKACCTIPPVVADLDTYEKKGKYETISDLRTYVTGPTDAKTGIFVIYDIFGLDFIQTIQGADILSSGTSSLAVIPDIFEGKPMPVQGFPADTPEKQENLGKFFAGPANPPKTVKKIKEKIFPAVKAKYPTVEKWAVLGYCWGGKVTTLLSGEGTPFAGSVQCHPAMLDPKDAEKLKIPHLCIATQNEDKAATEEFKNNIPDNLKPRCEVVYWEETFHGVMAARSDLQKPSHLEWYTKGYKKAVHFLSEQVFK